MTSTDRQLSFTLALFGACIVILTVALIISEKRVSYLEGRNSVAVEINNAVNDAVGPNK